MLSWNIRQVLEPRDGGLRAQRRRIGQAVEGAFEGGVASSGRRVVAVLVAGRDHQQVECG
jgi:hypothetical protein